MADQMGLVLFGPGHDSTLQGIGIPPKQRKAVDFPLPRGAAAGRGELENSSGLQDSVHFIEGGLDVIYMLDHACAGDYVELL